MAIIGSVRAIGSGQMFFSTSCRNELWVCVKWEGGRRVQVSVRWEGGRRVQVSVRWEGERRVQVCVKVGGWEESAVVHTVYLLPS